MLSPEDELHQQWLAAMTAAGLDGPQSVGAPEYGVTVPLVPGQPAPAPPPPPPPPPPQQIGAPAPAQQEMSAAYPMPSRDPDAEWRAAMQSATEPDQIEMPEDYVGRDRPDQIEMPAEYVGRQGAPEMPSEYGAAPEMPAEYGDSPEQSLPAVFDPTDPGTWASPTLGPVGHRRTGVEEGEQPLSEEEYLSLSPLERADYDFRQNQRAEDFANKRMAEIQKTNAARAAEDERIFLAAQDRARQETEAAMADADALAKEKPERFADSLGNVLSGLAAIVLGGIGAPANGGKNVGAEALSQHMDRFANEQIQEYNRRQGAIDRRLNMAAKLRDAGYSEYQARSVIRMAGLRRAQEQLATEAQNFDPRGTSARKYGQYMLKVAGEMDKAAQDFNRQSTLDQIKNEELRKARLENEQREVKLRGIGKGGGGKPKPGNLTAEDVKREIGDMNANVPDRPEGYTLTEAKRAVDLYKAGREVRQLDSNEQRAAAAEVRELGIGGPDGKPLINDDGEPFKAGSKESKDALTKQANAAREVADIIDEVLSIRDRVGGESKLWNSDARQQLDVLQNRLVVLEKGGTQGMSSDEDMKKLAAAIGADDVASFRSKAAGLEKGRERTVGFLNQTLRSNQYTGKPIVVPNRFKLGASKPTVVDETLDRAMKAPYSHGDGGVNSAIAAKLPAQQQLNSSFEGDVNALAAQAQFAPSDKLKQSARAALENLAAKHPTEEGKAFAAAALANLPGAAPVRER